MFDSERYIKHPLGAITHPIGFIKHFRAKRTLKKTLKNEATEDFLTLQLDVMKWYYVIHPKYTENFTGSYWFKDKDRGERPGQVSRRRYGDHKGPRPRP